MKAQITALILVAMITSGCLHHEKTFSFEAPEGPVAWTFVRADGEESERVAEPWVYVDSQGEHVTGFRSMDVRPDASQFFVPIGPGDGVMYTSIDDLHSYRWDQVSREIVGFPFIGKVFRSGDAGTSSFGRTSFQWVVERASPRELVLNWTTGDGNVISRFEDQIPVPVEVTLVGSTSSLVKRTDYRSLDGGQDARPPVPSVRPPDLAEFEFSAPSGDPFSFAAAESVWHQDDRYFAAQDWWSEHPAAILIWLDYTVFDENEGNATAYLWEARYYDAGSLLSVGAAWRVTHPSPDFSLRYPLYDACPSGCVDPYGGIPRIADVQVPATAPNWPPTGITLESTMARVQDLGETDAPSRLRWRTVTDEPGLPNAAFGSEARLILVHDAARSTWNATPQTGALEGRLVRTSITMEVWSEHVIETGDLVALQTKAGRPF